MGDTVSPERSISFWMKSIQLWKSSRYSPLLKSGVVRPVCTETLQKKRK